MSPKSDLRVTFLCLSFCLGSFFSFLFFFLIGCEMELIHLCRIPGIIFDCGSHILNPGLNFFIAVLNLILIKLL